MKRIIPILIALLPFFSCIKESFNNGFGDGEQLDLTLSINTRAPGGRSDETIDKVRIIVVKENGDKVFGKVVTPLTPDADPLEYQITLVAGTYHFLVVCNESPELTEKLNSATTRDEIEHATFEVQNLLEPPFVMYGHVHATVRKEGDAVLVNYGSGDRDRLHVATKRVAANVSLSIIKSSAAIKKISNLKAAVVQRPMFNLLGENNDYTGGYWMANQGLLIRENSTDVLHDNATYQLMTSESGFAGFDINGQCIFMQDLYIPENSLTDPSQNKRNTYLEITADCELAAGPTIPAKWRIDFVKDGSYGVKRNHHYHILAKIQDVGAMDLYADILPVTEVDVEIGWGLIEGLTIVSDRTDKYGLNEDVWNNSDKLTGLLKVYTPASEGGSETYQDVVFKYGSVLAIASDNDSYSVAKIGWSPPDYLPPTSYADIPYTASGNINAGQLGGTNLPADVNRGIGDPCRLVRLSRKQIQAGVVDNNQWRMMTEEEMSRLITANDAQDIAFTVPDTRGYYAYHSWLIPTNTPRHEATGEPEASADEGFYWTSEEAKAFTFRAGDQSADQQQIAAANPQKAGTIRCIRTVVPEKVRSVMTHTVAGSQITYKGGEKVVQVTTNIPYWTARLSGVAVTERTSGVASPDTSFDRFSFDSGTPAVLETSGMNSATLHAYLERYASNTHNSLFTITLTGFGYDGQTLTRTIAISQIPFDWEARVVEIQGASGATINGAPSIKQIGETISALVQIQPADVPLPTGGAIGLHVDAYFTTSKITGSNNTIADIVASHSGSRLIRLNNVVVDTNQAPNPRTIFVIPALSGLPYITNVRMSVLQEANSN